MQSKGRRTFGDFPPAQKRAFVGLFVVVAAFCIVAVLDPLSIWSVALFVVVVLMYLGLKRWIERTVPRR